MIFLETNCNSTSYLFIKPFVHFDSALADKDLYSIMAKLSYGLQSLKQSPKENGKPQA